MTEILKYQCVEIWTESGKFYKKIYQESHDNGGAEIEIESKEFYKVKNFIIEAEIS